MEQKILGELFGVEVHSPITRSEIRAVVKNQLKHVTQLINTGLTEDQARFDIVDQFESFFSSLSSEDKIRFEKIHAEEVSVAPKEWFGDLTGRDGMDDKYLTNDNAGVLYDVVVEYPFTRDNIRTIVQARSDLMVFLANTHGISIYQASNDLSDEQRLFTEKLSLTDQEKFLNLMTEEMNAHTNALNDETLKINQQTLEQEASNQSLGLIAGAIVIFAFLTIMFFIISK